MLQNNKCRTKRAGRKLLCGGGGDTEAHFPNPPPSLAAVTGVGVQGGGARPAVLGGGGGVNPTSMAQNDTHVALIILTTQMWGGGNYWWKKLFRAKICVPAPSAPTSVLTQNKEPDTEALFSNPPPLLRRASMSPPPLPPAEQFSGRQALHWQCHRHLSCAKRHPESIKSPRRGC